MVPFGVEEMIEEDCGPGEQAENRVFFSLFFFFFQPLFYYTFGHIFEERPRIAIRVKEDW